MKEMKNWTVRERVSSGGKSFWSKEREGRKDQRFRHLGEITVVCMASRVGRKERMWRRSFSGRSSRVVIESLLFVSAIFFLHTIRHCCSICLSVIIRKFLFGFQQHSTREMSQEFRLALPNWRNFVRIL